MKRLQSAGIDAGAARELENAVNTASGLLDALGALMMAQVNTDLTIYVESIKGLGQLAGRESENLRARFDAFIVERERKGGVK